LDRDESKFVEYENALIELENKLELVRRENDFSVEQLKDEKKISENLRGDISRLNEVYLLLFSTHLYLF
jgi:hypothetical protein